MQKLRTKLRSEQGASILFALFFFIVCAVIGSIVLTAATAAAGRLSRVKEMDERYYAVNSAAQVLEKEINSAVVDISQETALKWNGSDWESIKSDFDAFHLLFGDNHPATEEDYSSNQSKERKELSGTLMEMVKYVPAVGKTEDEILMGYSLGDSLLQDHVTVHVIIKMQCRKERNMPPRSLLVTIIGESEDGDKGSYSLTLKCPAHTDEREEYKEKTQWAAAGGGAKYRLKTNKEEITWSVAAVVKGAERWNAS